VTDIIVPVLCNAGTSYSAFTDQPHTLEDYSGLFISPRINALSFHHRASLSGYFSSWHVAGDPTLIIIRTGTLRIGLRDGSYHDFTAGDVFIAQDKLPENGDLMIRYTGIPRN